MALILSYLLYPPPSSLLQVNRFMATSHIKLYFDVDTNYVLKKLRLLFFPFTHSDWSLRYQQETEPVPVPPRQDSNTPDLYIPGELTLEFGKGGGGG